MIIIEVTHDRYFGKEFGDTGLQCINIPAYLENNKLIIGHHGESELCFPYYIPNYNAEDFEFFCNHKYRRAKESNPHYIYKGNVYELMGATDNKKNILCTFLTPCRKGTFLCKCKDCGENFVIDCYESPYYYVKELSMPTVRCKNCISKRKNKNNKIE